MDDAFDNDLFDEETPYRERERGRGGVRDRDRGRKRGGMAPWQIVFFGCGGAGVIVLVLVVGVLAWIGTTGPSTEVLRGKAVASKWRTEITQMELLKSDEQLRWFYSWGLLALTEGFVALTDQCLIVYYGVELGSDGEGEGVRVALGDVTAIEMIAGSLLEDSAVTVWMADDTIHSFLLSTENGGDKRFLAALRKAVDAAGGSSATPGD